MLINKKNTLLWRKESGMCKSRKGIEDKANVTFLCTLDKSIEFWQILIKEMGSTFVYAALLIFLTLSFEQ